MAHASNGLIPLVNKGEIVLLFFAVFLILLSHGSGKWSLDNLFFKKKEYAEEVHETTKEAKVEKTKSVKKKVAKKKVSKKKKAVKITSEAEEEAI